MEAVNGTTEPTIISDLDAQFIKEWGFNLRETYKKALRFYKENEGKSVQLQYQDRIQLVAFTQQSLHGPFSPDTASPLGPLDVIGRDRRNAWTALGNMSREEAMKKFVETLLQSMPHLKPYLEAQRQEEEKKREEVERAQAESAAAAEREADEREAEQLQERERQRQEEQRRRIQDALNQQTFEQFKSFAEQQYPNNPDQQAVMIRHLQEQHYHQYMQQIYQQQMEAQANQTLSCETNKYDNEPVHVALTGLTLDEQVNPIPHEPLDGEDHEVKENGDEEEHTCSEECGFCQDEELPPASMWTKKEIAEFKESVRKEGGDSIIKVGHGETVTVRVPTHKDGSALFWEFATDSYDIAFGLFFEWTPTDESEVSVHISDSEDEDINEEEEDESGDPEAAGARTALVEKGPPTSVIIPIYRRDCHDEVYAGTHAYPGRGVYLLKFDNTYSLWRSKTLYYRVYYTK